MTLRRRIGAFRRRPVASRRAVARYIRACVAHGMGELHNVRAAAAASTTTTMPLLSTGDASLLSRCHGVDVDVYVMCVHGCTLAPIGCWIGFAIVVGAVRVGIVRVCVRACVRGRASVQIQVKPHEIERLDAETAVTVFLSGCVALSLSRCLWPCLLCLLCLCLCLSLYVFMCQCLSASLSPLSL